MENQPVILSKRASPRGWEISPARKELRQAQDPRFGNQPVSPEGFAEAEDPALTKRDDFLYCFCRDSEGRIDILSVFWGRYRWTSSRCHKTGFAAVSYQLELLASQPSPRGSRKQAQVDILDDADEKQGETKPKFHFIFIYFASWKQYFSTQSQLISFIPWSKRGRKKKILCYQPLSWINKVIEYLDGLPVI